MPVNPACSKSLAHTCSCSTHRYMVALSPPGVFASTSAAVTSGCAGFAGQVVSKGGENQTPTGTQPAGRSRDHFAGVGEVHRAEVAVEHVVGARVHAKVGNDVRVDEAQARSEVGVQAGSHVVLGRGGVHGVDPAGGVVHGQVRGVTGGTGAEVGQGLTGEVTEDFRARPILLTPRPAERVGDGVVPLGAGPAVVVP
ncbi:hypothetical protein SCALM49S_01066 [Streptomyces californicus]